MHRGALDRAKESRERYAANQQRDAMEKDKQDSAALGVALYAVMGRPGHARPWTRSAGGASRTNERSTVSGNMKVTDQVRVYNDREGGPLEKFLVPSDATGFFEDDPAGWTNIGTYIPANRKLTLGTAVDRVISAALFEQWTAANAPKPTDGGAEINVPGTYFGATGHYFCDTSKTCTVGTVFSGYFLSADWHFVHLPGAKVLERDLRYLYFGWWVRHDANGMPAAVSAFYQSVGGGVELATVGGSLNVNRGTAATYEGPAIGWYAIKGDGGHGDEFTATATLKAQFGTANLNAETGLTGTTHDFKLKNGMENDWSVSLNKAGWTTDPSGDTAAPKGHIVNTEKTVWSINGVKAAPAATIRP